MHIRLYAASAGAVLLSVAAVTSTPATTAQDAHAAMNHRGAAVMGFDQDKTAHHFYLYPDGGAIDIGVKDASDQANRQAIRAHLPHIAAMFGDGNFSAPMIIHATAVPGIAELARLKARVAYRYQETAAGGRVDIQSSDPDAIAALHAFLRFQITDHKTGDPLEVRRR
jgi:hypothetical protein